MNNHEFSYPITAVAAGSAIGFSVGISIGSGDIGMVSE